MRILFFGSGAFAISSFEALLGAGHELVALVTQPDREKGRGRRLASPPLKRVAERNGIAVLQPPRVREPGLASTLVAYAPEVQVVVAYGQILPGVLLRIPPHGTLNVHASLLPAYRGAAPIQWAIVNGEQETGVTTMLLDEGLDTGPILLARSTPIGSEETAAELTPRLASLGAALLLETLRGIEQGSLRPVPQDATLATLAPPIRRIDGRIDWGLTAQAIACRVRGFQPWPGAWTLFAGRSVKVLRAGTASEAHASAPGSVVAVGREALLVACGERTTLAVTEVQPESRRPMAAPAFASGARLRPGDRFATVPDPR